MKDEVVSKEEFSKPQLAVQSYLDELLQEATLDIQDVDSFDVDNTASSEVETANIVVKETASIPQEIEEDLEKTAAVEERREPVEDIKEPQQKIELEERNNTNTDVQTEENDSSNLPESSIQEERSVQTRLESEALIDDKDTVADTPIAVKTESIESEIYEIEPKLEKSNDLPWAESRFECLLFNVGGLKIAVPLVELGSIQKANMDTITSIFGQPDWFIGISTVNDLRIRAVDTAKWVMPNHYKGELKQTFNFIIQLDRSDWGLACEEVAEAITLEPSEVKWRADRTKRPWLAGTVIKHMCAILDVQGFINLLDDPDNGFKPTLK